MTSSSPTDAIDTTDGDALNLQPTLAVTSSLSPLPPNYADASSSPHHDEYPAIELSTVVIESPVKGGDAHTNGKVVSYAAVPSSPSPDGTAALADLPPSKPAVGGAKFPASTESTANFLSRVFFWWLNPIMTLGAERPLMMSDMYALMPHIEARQNSDEFDKEWAIELQKASDSAVRGDAVVYEASITNAMYRIFFVPFWIGFVCKLFIDGLGFLQPILLEYLLVFLFTSQIPGTAPPPVWQGYLLAVAIGVNPFVTTLLNNLYFEKMMVVGLRSRTILTTQLYKKSLKLSPAAKQKMNTGQIVNSTLAEREKERVEAKGRMMREEMLMSTDAAKVDMFMGYAHFIWSALEQVIVAIALLIRAIGPPALAGVAVVIITLPIQGFVMKKLLTLRTGTVKYTDARVKLMNEILQGIRVIKVYAWEKSFLQKLLKIRDAEMAFVKTAAYVRAINSTIMQTAPVLMSLLAFITVGLTSTNFQPQFIFSSLVLFNLLRMPLIMFPMTLAFWSDARIGINRITAFLLAEELSSAPEYVSSEFAQENGDFAIRITDANFSWEKVEHEVTATNLTASQAAAQVEAQTSASKKAAIARAIAIHAASSRTLAQSPKAADLEQAQAQNLEVRERKMLVSKSSASAAEDAKEKESAPFHLDNVNVLIPRGGLTVIVGAVGSGKSSLLSGLLGEMKRVGGSVQISGSVGYCPQQAWIQNATLRENILFGLPYDERKYKQAVKYTAMQPDIDVLPAGDATEIGEKGITLSGGQKARTSLARAVYFDADIILLDDPLSAVDAHVSKFLFNSCICSKLANKTRVLVTHQLQYVSSCDQVLFVEAGVITESGSYSKLMSDKGNFYKLMSTYVGEEDDGESDEEEEATDDFPKSADEEKSNGVATDSASSSSAAAPSGRPSFSRLTTKKPFSPRKKGLKTAVSSAGGDTSRGGSMIVAKALTPEEAEAAKKAAAVAESLMQAEERTKGGVPMDVYFFYVAHTGGWIMLTIAMGLLFAQTAASSWTTWWLGLWSSNTYNQTNMWYLGIYAALGLGQCVFALIGTMTMAYMGVLAATQLHNKSFESVMRAPLSFFDTTPIGRIVNRFSRDQDVMDSTLMDTLRMMIFMVCIIVATFIMIIIVTPLFLVPLAPIMIVYYVVQKRFRHSSREIKRIESISRSPLTAHFSETLTGLATIRAYRAQATFEAVNQDRMDGNNRPYYILVLSQRWLSIRVETIGAFVSFFAALIVVTERNTLSPGQAGVSLTYAIGVTALLNWVVRQTVEAENAMNSVERSKFYTHMIKHEAPADVPEVDDKLKASNWPTQGAIEFKDLQVRYRDGLPLVLNGISLNIAGGQRIGIVGRTGAGKSSLMVALLRIVEAASGSINIDGVDISTMGLDQLRSSLAIIPQDPVLYSGTVRSNLDPFDKFSDEELWSVLDKAQLKNAIVALEKGLKDPVSEGGENFSLGQRCQICLARAMLRNARVLIMDEATASVDMETDSAIQTSLRSNFNCTLLTIAHRLNTICDYDRILVLSFGRIAEFDTPAKLLRDPNSAFSSMVNETGETNAAMLRSIAYDAEKGLAINMDALLHASGDDATKAATAVHRNSSSVVAAAAETAAAVDDAAGETVDHIVFKTTTDDE